MEATTKTRAAIGLGSLATVGLIAALGIGGGGVTPGPTPGGGSGTDPNALHGTQFDAGGQAMFHASQPILSDQSNISTLLTSGDFYFGYEGGGNYDIHCSEGTGCTLFGNNQNLTWDWSSTTQEDSYGIGMVFVVVNVLDGGTAYDFEMVTEGAAGGGSSGIIVRAGTDVVLDVSRKGTIHTAGQVCFGFGNDAGCVTSWVGGAAPSKCYVSNPGTCGPCDAGTCFAEGATVSRCSTATADAGVAAPTTECLCGWVPGGNGWHWQQVYTVAMYQTGYQYSGYYCW